MKILREKTYLKMIENSIGTKIFNSIFAEVEGQEKDLLNDGEFSCAVFVSGILLLNQMLEKGRSTVDSLEKDLEESDSFEEIKSDPQPGDILFWEKVRYEDGSENRHVGFTLSNTEAVSTDYVPKQVIKHPINKEIENSGETRKIEKIFRYRF